MEDTANKEHDGVGYEEIQVLSMVEMACSVVKSFVSMLIGHGVAFKVASFLMLSMANLVELAEEWPLVACNL